MSNDVAVTLEDGKGTCQVCHGQAAGFYFGALVCLPCKSFYIRCTKDGVKLRCQQDDSACKINKGRFKCQACRFKACIAAGMQRKEEKPEVISAPAGASLCRVCGDIANGVHFGVTSCEGCKKFFRRGLTEFQGYACKDGGNCVINPRTRNQCRACRYTACITAGMSREAIKVGRPPSKKENSRHHPYSHQINLSTNHHNSSPKLYTDNNYVQHHQNGLYKQEVPWIPNETHTLASLPALIHNGANYMSQPIIGKQDLPLQVDLNSSCTSTEIHDMLQNYLDPNNEMGPLPAHFNLEETLTQIDMPPAEPTLTQRSTKLQGIENLPLHQQQRSQQQQPSYHQQQITLSAMAAQAKNIQLQPIKIENTTSYRNPVQPQTYPSPPYEANYNNHSGASVYQTYTAAINQNQQRSFPVSQYLATNHNLSNQSNGTYNPNPISPFNGAKPNQGPVFNQSMVNQGSSGHQLVFESVANANGNNGDSMGQGQRFNQSYGESRQQRHSCDVAAKQHQMQQQDMTNPYSQSNLSPGFSSAASSPQTNTTSGYATDSQDFLEEFSIYDPMDIREVNHKYMPSCSYEPLIFNEEALNVEDIWSKNEKKPESETESKVSTTEPKEKKTAGSGMFKPMKSIEDKISQEYWYEHEMPDVEYTALLAKELDYLMRGWVKCKEYIGSNLKPTSSGTSSTSSTPDESKQESHWPIVKENAPIQLKLWEFITNRQVKGAEGQVMLFQHIKGCDKVPAEVQKTLVTTANFSNCLLINILYWWDEDREQCRYFWSWKIPPSDPFYVFRQTLMKFSRAIRDLNFDEKEMMLVSALTLFSSDIKQLKEKDVIEKERKPLTRLCAAYLKDKYGDMYKKRYTDLLTMVPALRYLSIWHSELMTYSRSFGSKSVAAASSVADINMDKMTISES